MRPIISPPRHYHFGRQRGFHPTITSSTTSQLKINWTSPWSLDKQLRKWTTNESIPPLSISSSQSDYSYHSPLLRSHHTLLSRTRNIAAAAPRAGTQIQSKSLASLSSSLESLKLAGIGSGLWRLPGKMSILNRRLHLSSSHTFNRSLFSTTPAMLASLPSHQLPRSENSEFFHISAEVREALGGNVPVVALESAIITHGMPFPDNIDTAFLLESIIREHGVIPATVGVIRGRLTVGLSPSEIEVLGASANKKCNSATSNETNPHHPNSMDPVVKVSRRDLPFALSHKLNGGTTVSGTIIAAVKAGIPIFATGGLGGVHRGAETTFDISADLKELGRNQIGIVSAGVKSILDIGKTLEYMETEGISVAVLKKEEPSDSQQGSGSERKIQQQIGSTKFPSFFTAESPFIAPYSVRSEMEAASLIHSSFQLRLNSGVLIAVPIPKEEEGVTGKIIEDAIRTALEEAERNSIQGKDMTPFLLSQVNRLTDGLSLKANKHLIENNVRSACGIATHLALLRKQGREKNPLQYPYSSSSPSPNSSEDNGSGQSRASLGSMKQQTYEQGHSSSIDGVGSELPGLENSRQWRNSGEISTGLSSAKQLQKRHERPVVIGGTSLDLVIAIQESEIVEIAHMHSCLFHLYEEKRLHGLSTAAASAIVALFMTAENFDDGVMIKRKFCF